MGKECSTNGAKRNSCRILVRKPGGKGQKMRIRCKKEYNINKDLLEIELGGVVWIDLAHERKSEGL
jgi:hypothetical protein